MRLTEHFSLDEFLTSDTATEHGLTNDPAPEHCANIRKLAEGMERVRALFGVPIHICSGYRSPEINMLVGGVPTSDHALGWACDFHVTGLSDMAAAGIIRKANFRWDQLIWERNRCVHISFNPRFRQQVLSQPGGPGTPVFTGIY